MKKSLIALAVAGTVAAPAAFAATSNVDIYGKLHVSVSFVDGQADGTQDMQVSSNASRIGFKGSEDLGGGLKGIWQIESGVNIDEGNGTLASRNSFLGLAGGFGTVLVGKHDTPLKLVGRKYDLFGDTMADSRNVLGGGSDARANNVVAYISPTFGGFHVAAAWTNDLAGTGSSGDKDEQSAYNLAAFYDGGIFSVAGAYGDGDYHEVNGLGSHWRVGGSVNLGDFRIVGQYDNLESENGDDVDGWMAGGSFAMGPIVLKANYMENDADAEQWTVGADYNLSKRTSAYVLYADGDNVSYGKGAGNSDQIPADSILSLGITHSF
jgi:predicted porin